MPPTALRFRLEVFDKEASQSLPVFDGQLLGSVDNSRSVGGLDVGDHARQGIECQKSIPLSKKKRKGRHTGGYSMFCNPLYIYHISFQMRTHVSVCVLCVFCVCM